jgi:spore maturation protein CgeB
VNVTRAEMAQMGHCPSPRLFEAAACGVPVLSDWFDGLDAFFTPGEEIHVERNADEATHAISLPRMAHERMGRRARERAVAEHTADARAEELVSLCDRASRGVAAGGGAPDVDGGTVGARGPGAAAERFDGSLPASWL